MDTLDFSSAVDWAEWLGANYARPDGVWLRLAKRGSQLQSVTYAEALETALCYGWIDGQKKGESAQAWLQKFTPRRARSLWSAVNRAAATKLIEAGRMKPSGLAEVERARTDGRWDRAYASPTNATVPPDLRQALDQNHDAAAFFATLNSQNRYAVLWRIETARKPETRARRIEKLVAMLSRGERFH